jgi:gamma-glutamyltranspeptidase/glutathione hydrolase
MVTLMKRLWAFSLIFFAASPSIGQEAPRPAVVVKNGMAVCTSPVAADVGNQILQQGGNAVDATIAVAFAEAVTYPIAGNIGGGGFMLIHPPAGQGEPTFIDYREKAPAKATIDMFAKERDARSHLAVGVPGTVAGLELAFQKYGSKKKTWAELVEPAIRLAEDGWTLEPWSARSLNRLVQSSPKHDELRRVFGKPDGQWQAGDLLKQPDLAKTLRLIAQHGSRGFYEGPVAELFAKEMELGGGLISLGDLQAYQAKERRPIHGTYRGYDVWSAPPPSSGGMTLVEMLNILENFDMKSLGADSAARWHLTIEAMRRAYLDRARHLGDPDFVKIPDLMSSKDYAKSLAAGINRNHATRSATLATDIALAKESDNTTHISVVDADGLAVSQTYTLEESYGSRVVVRGAGFILNNEMMDFNPVPGVTNDKGMIGTPPNVVAPGKRMLSSMTPTIIAKNGKPLLVTGSPGGRTIINTVLCITTNVIDHDMPVQQAVDFPRLHHQWMPDEVSLEKARERSSLVEALKKMGHNMPTNPNRGQGDGHSIWIDPKTGERHGAADRRIMGKASGY